MLLLQEAIKVLAKLTLEEFAKNGANVFACTRTITNDFKKFTENLKKAQC